MTGSVRHFIIWGARMPYSPVAYGVVDDSGNQIGRAEISQTDRGLNITVIDNPAPSERSQCGNCTHWLPLVHPGIGGLCRRYPPATTHPERYRPIDIWPRTSACDLCGEHTPKGDA